MLTATKVSVNRKSLRPLNIFDNDEIDDNTLLTCVKKQRRHIMIRATGNYGRETGKFPSPVRLKYQSNTIFVRDLLCDATNYV